MIFDLWCHSLCYTPMKMIALRYMRTDNKCIVCPRRLRVVYLGQTHFVYLVGFDVRMLQLNCNSKIENEIEMEYY